jgi:hypothetical protein
MKYRHYKGGIYEFICEARLESAPDVAVIIYKSEDGAFWSRQKNEFFELVLHEGITIQRFAPIN